MGIFAPIYATGQLASEKWGFLRPATTLFHFGQKSYQIEVLDGCLSLRQVDRKPHWTGVVCRVALIMTIVIPILALVATAIYRSANHFSGKNYFEIIPKEVFPRIFNYAILDVPSLARTSKGFNALISPKQVLIGG